MHRMQQDYEVAAYVVVVFFCSSRYSHCLLNMNPTEVPAAGREQLCTGDTKVRIM